MCCAVLVCLLLYIMGFRVGPLSVITGTKRGQALYMLHRFVPSMNTAVSQVIVLVSVSDISMSLDVSLH